MNRSNPPVVRHNILIIKSFLFIRHTAINSHHVSSHMIIFIVVFRILFYILHRFFLFVQISIGLLALLSLLFNWIVLDISIRIILFYVESFKKSVKIQMFQVIRAKR
jgi:energy-coupling factor transporter transmembrane protein EcfT